MITLDYLDDFSSQRLGLDLFKSSILDEFFKLEEVRSTYQELIDFFNNFALNVIDIFRENSKRLIDVKKINACYIYDVYKVCFFYKSYDLIEPIPIFINNPLNSVGRIPIKNLTSLPQNVRNEIYKDSSILVFDMNIRHDYLTNKLFLSTHSIDFSGRYKTLINFFCKEFSMQLGEAKDFMKMIELSKERDSLFCNSRLCQLLFELTQKEYDKNISDLRSFLTSLSQYCAPQDLFSLML